MTRFGTMFFHHVHRVRQTKRFDKSQPKPQVFYKNTKSQILPLYICIVYICIHIYMYICIYIYKKGNFFNLVFCHILIFDDLYDQEDMV